MTPEQRARIGASIITSNIPGSTITSGFRTPSHNAAVGGVSNSDHLWGGGIDFVPPKGVSNQQAIAMLRQSGADIRAAIDENDHIHVSFNKGFEGGLNEGKRLIEQGRVALLDFSRGVTDFAKGAANVVMQPLGKTIMDAAGSQVDPYLKRIGLGLLGVIMLTAVIFAMTKVDPIKLIQR